jgi:NADH-ubiquinone oxidoreductase chain 3
MNTLLMLLIFVPILVLILLALNLLFASHTPDSEKNQPYECGFYPKIESIFSKFNVFHFSLGLCFLIFDLEVLLLLPISVTMTNVDIFGLSVGLLFFIILTVGFVLELSQSVIKLTDLTSMNINNELFNNKEMLRQTFYNSMLITFLNLIITFNPQRFRTNLTKFLLQLFYKMSNFWINLKYIKNGILLFIFDLINIKFKFYNKNNGRAIILLNNKYHILNNYVENIFNLHSWNYFEVITIDTGFYSFEGEILEELLEWLTEQANKLFEDPGYLGDTENPLNSPDSDLHPENSDSDDQTDEADNLHTSDSDIDSGYLGDIDNSLNSEDSDLDSENEDR